MQLKSFGCSFIFGSELSDNSEELVLSNPMGQFSQLTWPAHLSTHFGYKYECYARPGSGNLQIAERILNELANNEPAFYVIGWTWIDRFDYYNLDDEWQPWSTIRPADTSEISTVYYRQLHSEYQDKLKSLMYMRLVIDTLKQKQIPFVMTYIDELTFDQQWHTSLAVLNLQEYIQPYMTTFDNLSFLDWSKKNGYPVTKIGHPLESAHRAAGDYLIKVFDKQKTNGQAQ
jgi:hypothetical protein